MPQAGSGARSDRPALLPSIPLEAPEPGTPTRRSPRDWAVDALCFLLALAAGFAIFVMMPDLNRLPVLLTLADVLLGLVACVALWWRRRYPVHLAVAVAPLLTFSAMASMAGTIALFTVAVHRRPAVVAPVTGLFLAVSLVYLAMRPDPSLPWWGELIFQLIATGAIVAWGMLVRARRQLVLSLRERALRAEAEQQLRVEQARQLERTRIAREMHDVLAHRISLVSVHAGALEFCPDAGPADVAASAGVIRESAHEALQDLRTILGVLRAEVAQDVPERPQPALADVPRLIAESTRAGMRVSCAIDVDDPLAVPAGIGRTAYRVVQEGVTNARKHAPGAEVAVTLEGGAGRGLTVEVANRRPVGPPVRPGIPGAGLGLAGLAERVGLCGGRLEQGHTANEDFRLGAWLPWPA